MSWNIWRQGASITWGEPYWVWKLPSRLGIPVNNGTDHSHGHIELRCSSHISSGSLIHTSQEDMDWRRLGPKKVRRYINPDMQIKSQVQGLTLSSFFFREYMFFIRHCSVLSVTTFVLSFSSDKLRKMRFVWRTHYIDKTYIFFGEIKLIFTWSMPPIKIHSVESIKSKFRNSS